MRIFISLCATASIVLLAPGAARADRDHFELDAAFITGMRAYDRASFSYEEGGASPAVLGPFQGAPFSGVSVSGVDTEMRLVISGIRTTFGFSKPYPRFAPPQTAEVVMAGGAVSTVQVRAVRAHEYRFGLGYEFDLGRASGFVDLLGTADRVTTDLVVDQDQSTYGSESFTYSLRAGVRVPIRKAFFVHMSGEGGIGGNVTWGARAGVGVRIN